jgi:hypothetical protein
MGADVVILRLVPDGLGRFVAAVRQGAPSWRRAVRSLVTAAAIATAVALQSAGALVPGAPALAASSPILLHIAGQAIVFAGSAKTGTIYLAQNGYVYENPGFDFERGQEVSGLSATPDIAIQTGLTTPYSVVGALARVPANGVLGSLAGGASLVPQVNELLVVLDSKGRYVLVQIEAVTPNALTFAYVFGTPENQPSSLGNVVWVSGHALDFPAATQRGQIVLSAGGEVSVSPGFDFEHGRQVSTLHSPAGLSAAVGANGAIELGGDMARVGANGHAGHWPAPATVTAVAGALYLLVDDVGNYVLLQVTAVSPTAVSFDYRLLDAGAVPVLAAGPTTLRIGGAAVTFTGPPRQGAILAANAGGDLVHPGFDLVRDREVAGLSANPDLLLTVMNGAVALEGTIATFAQLATGQPPSAANIAATPFGRFVAVDGDGRYVLVGIESATAQTVTFAYEIESAGPTAVLQPPNPASVPPPKPTNSAGAVIFSLYTNIGVNFGANEGTDPATGGYVSPGAMQLLKTYELAVGAYKIWNFAGLSALDEPLLSPDGRWLATVSGGDIVLRSASGQTRTIATNGDVMGGVLPVLRWSPDGRYLAYTGLVSESGYVSGGALWVIDPTSGKSRLVVDPLRTGLHVEYVGWLPRDQLLFSAKGGLWAITPDWTRVVRLKVDVAGMGQGGRFDVSHGGGLVTFVARDAKGHYQVVVATLDGKQRVQFTNSPYDNWSPVFAPDDSMVVCVANTGPPPGGEIWAFTLNGKQAGFIHAPGSQNPIDHVFDIEQWYAAGSAANWKGP